MQFVAYSGVNEVPSVDDEGGLVRIDSGWGGVGLLRIQPSPYLASRSPVCRSVDD